MNRAVIVGRLTKDPELRKTSGDVSVCNFTVAVDRRFSNQQGQREADFIPVVVWRVQADNCARFLKKGRQVAVMGSIQTRSYDAQDGSKRYVTEVVADEVEFLGSARDNDGASAPAGDFDRPARNAAAAPDMRSVEDDELPF